MALKFLPDGNDGSGDGRACADLYQPTQVRQYDEQRTTLLRAAHPGPRSSSRMSCHFVLSMLSVVPRLLPSPRARITNIYVAHPKACTGSKKLLASATL